MYLSLQSMRPLMDHPNIDCLYLSLSLSIVLVLSILCPSTQALSLPVTSHRVIAEYSSRSQPHITGVDPARSNTPSNWGKIREYPHTGKVVDQGYHWGLRRWWRWMHSRRLPEGLKSEKYGQGSRSCLF